MKHFLVKTTHVPDTPTEEASGRCGEGFRSKQWTEVLVVDVASRGRWVRSLVRRSVKQERLVA